MRARVRRIKRPSSLPALRRVKPFWGSRLPEPQPIRLERRYEASGGRATHAPNVNCACRT